MSEIASQTWGVRRILPAVALALTVAMLATAVPGIVHSVGRDAASAATLRGCGKAYSATAAQGAAGDAEAAWLNAAAALCSGTPQQKEDALRALLQVSDARLSVARSAAPTRVTLARLAAERYPRNPEAQLWLGDSLKAANQGVEAVAAYRRGLELQPTDADGWYNLGGLYEAKGDLKAALSAYNQACAHVDHSKGGCLKAGQLYLQAGQYDAALTQFERFARQVGYTVGTAERGLAAAYIGLGRAEEAVPHLRYLAARGDKAAQAALEKIEGERLP